MSLHLKLGLTVIWDGISSVSHATLKNALVFPKRLFSVLALFIANYYLTLRLTVGTSAFGASYPILLPLKPTSRMRRLTLNGFLSSRPYILRCLRGVSSFPYTFVMTSLVG